MQVKWDLKVSPKNIRIPRNLHRLIIYDFNKLSNAPRGSSKERGIFFG